MPPRLKKNLLKLLIFGLTIIAKSLFLFSKLTRLGSGTSLPGLLVEKFCPFVIKELTDFDQIILITGTNGKTTTRALLVHIWENQGFEVCTNRGGANILRGIAATLLLNRKLLGGNKSQVAILEVEEATLPILTKYLTPNQLILTNIFRDQLDAYGEIDQTLRYFSESIATISKNQNQLNSHDFTIETDNHKKELETQKSILPKSQKSTKKILNFENEQNQSNNTDNYNNDNQVERFKKILETSKNKFKKIGKNFGKKQKQNPQIADENDAENYENQQNYNDNYKGEYDDNYEENYTQSYQENIENKVKVAKNVQNSKPKTAEKQAIPKQKKSKLNWQKIFGKSGEKMQNEKVVSKSTDQSKATNTGFKGLFGRQFPSQNIYENDFNKNSNIPKTNLDNFDDKYEDEYENDFENNYDESEENEFETESENDFETEFDDKNSFNSNGNNQNQTSQKDVIYEEKMQNSQSSSNWLSINPKNLENQEKSKNQAQNSNQNLSKNTENQKNKENESLQNPKIEVIINPNKNSEKIENKTANHGSQKEVLSKFVQEKYWTNQQNKPNTKNENNSRNNLNNSNNSNNLENILENKFETEIENSFENEFDEENNWEEFGQNREPKSPKITQEKIVKNQTQIIVNLDDYKLLSCLENCQLPIIGFGVGVDSEIRPTFEKSENPFIPSFKNKFVAQSVAIRSQISRFVVPVENTELSVETSLTGVFNLYNVMSAISSCYQTFGAKIVSDIASFQPVFGRGEIIELKSDQTNNQITLYLVKNPAGFEQVLDLIIAKNKENNQISLYQKNSNEPSRARHSTLNLGFLINDKIADGKDMSWLWDVDFEKFGKNVQINQILTGGIRGGDVLLRLHQAQFEVSSEDYQKNMDSVIEKIQENNQNWIICATYTAMMEFRTKLGHKTKLKKIDDTGF